MQRRVTARFSVIPKIRRCPLMSPVFRSIGYSLATRAALLTKLFQKLRCAAQNSKEASHLLDVAHFNTRILAFPMRPQRKSRITAVAISNAPVMSLCLPGVTRGAVLQHPPDVLQWHSSRGSHPVSPLRRETGTVAVDNIFAGTDAQAYNRDRWLGLFGISWQILKV